VNPDGMINILSVSLKTRQVILSLFVYFILIRANVDDREESVIDTLTDKVFGKLYADKGYI